MRELWLLWRRFTLRHWRLAPRSHLLLVLLLALGVGVFLSIRLANRAAVAGFTLFTETLTGNSDFFLVPPSGRLDDAALREMRAALDPLPVSLFPVIETTASEPGTGAAGDGFDADQFQLVGLDVMALRNLIYLEGPDYEPPKVASDRPAGKVPRLSDLLGAAKLVFVSHAFAEARGARAGDVLSVVINDAVRNLEIVGVLPDYEFRTRAPENLLLMDLPAVQQLSGEPGRIDRVEVRLPAGERNEALQLEVRERLEAGAQGRWVVETPQTQRSTGDRMTRAFRMNLTVLSCLALLVGVYLILQALEAAVVRRRTEIAILRSLGVSPVTIRRVWLAEAFTLGVVGSLLGLALGYLGAQFAVKGVAQSVSVHYFSTTTAAAALDPRECTMAFLLGLGASCLAGWLPARDAALTPPAQVLQRGLRVDGIRLFDHPVLGCIALLAGAALYRMPPLPLEGGGRFPVAGYATAVLWVSGASMLAGVLFRPLSRLAAGLFPDHPLVRYAASQWAYPNGRHRLTVAGLLIAISMSAGMGILIHSFDTTIRSWIGQVLRADLFAAPQGIQNASNQNRIRPETWRKLANDPAVANYEIGQIYRIRVAGQPAYLMGSRWQDSPEQLAVVWVEQPSPDEEWLVRKEAADAFPALVSESFAERFGKRRGDRIPVPTPEGEKLLQIVGVYADYSSELGFITVRRDYLADWFDDQRALSLAFFLKEGVDPDDVRRRWMSEHPGLGVRSNARLREEVFEIFRQTFSITYALKGIGVVVAVAGLALALVSLLLERRRELGTLKELGLSRREIALATAIEGSGVALIGCVSGMILSLFLGHLLIYVINKQSFGWTLSFQVPVGELALLALAVMVTSVAVAYAVGWWGGRLKAEHEE